MNRYAWVVGLALVANACAASVNVEQEKAALMQRDRDWSAASKDADNFVSFLAPDASLYPHGMPVVTGTDAARKMHAEMTAAPGFALSWTPTKAEVSRSGEVGYTTGTYEAGAGGTVERGKYVTVWKKVDGTWKVAEDAFNADAAAPKPPHAMVNAAGLKWGDGPPALPPGAKMAVVSGDPSQPAPFILRAQVPAGYRVPPHWHPTTENLTVLSGTVALGMGDSPDAAMQELTSGGSAVLPAEMRHVFQAKTAATFQVHGIGPFAVTYVNPADDPRQKVAR